MEIAGADLPVYMSSGGSPSFDLDFEDRLLRDKDARRPALFVYSWARPVLIIGRGQPLSDVNEAVCRAEDIPILRRRTGGTAVLHNGSVNLALVLPSSHSWAGSIRGLYGRFIGVVSSALKAIGIFASPLGVADSPRPGRSPICFEADSGETLILNKRKVFGCAQHRSRDTVLVHGTLLLGLDAAQQGRVFNVPASRIERSLSAIPSGVDPRAVEDALIRTISTEPAFAPDRRGAQYDGSSSS